MDQVVAFEKVDAAQAFRQGDILCRETPDGYKDWAVIITADCDIVNDKAGFALTQLRIVTAKYYLENLWASEALRKFARKGIVSASQIMSRAAKQVNPLMEDLSDQDLVEWLTVRSIDEILAMIGNQSEELIKILRTIKFALGLDCQNQTPFSRLRAIWRLDRLSPKSQFQRLEQALDYNKSADYVFLPSLPNEALLGYVVLLRSFENVTQSEIHRSLLNARLVGRQYAWHRIGRLADFLRYSITQRMAFLYSRIGMRSEFEDRCDEAVEHALQRLIGKEDN